MAVTHVPECWVATSRSISSTRLPEQHRHVAADGHAALVQHPVPEPPGPVEQLAPRAGAGEVVDRRRVGIRGDEVEEAHGRGSWQRSSLPAL